MEDFLAVAEERELWDLVMKWKQKGQFREDRNTGRYWYAFAEKGQSTRSFRGNRLAGGSH